ncbi:MAG: magnesium transporter [Rickettsiales bacterium]|jgi:magnesium transporter|nr:magnesium transporter [Rickettsiales bacterium]
MPEMDPAHEESHTSPGDTDTSYGLDKTDTQEIIATLDAIDLARFRSLVADLHSADMADLIYVLNYDQRRTLVDFIRERFDPALLVDLDDGVREEIITLLGVVQSAEAISKLELSDALQVIEDLDEEMQQSILQALPEDYRERLKEGLSHPEDSAGRITNQNIVSVPEFWTVGQTIDYLRTAQNLPDDFFQIYVVDPKYCPVGGVSVSRVVRSTRDIVIRDIMNTDLKLINPDMDQEEVAFVFRQYGLTSAPVINEDGRLVGVISMGDIVEVIDEEAEEDIMHLGGVSEINLHANLLETAKSRFPWLMVNLLTALLASSVIAFFQGEIQKFVALAVLMPIVASMGGNAGIQSLTVAVRALATKDLTTTNAFRVIIKETLSGGVNGVLLAIVTGGIAYLRYEDMVLGLVIGGAIIMTLLLAGFAGIAIPLILVRFGADPAIASGIFLTAVTDVVAFATFLGFAAIFLI